MGRRRKDHQKIKRILFLDLNNKNHQYELSDDGKLLNFPPPEPLISNSHSQPSFLFNQRHEINTIINPPSPNSCPSSPIKQNFNVFVEKPLNHSATDVSRKNKEFLPTTFTGIPYQPNPDFVPDFFDEDLISINESLDNFDFDANCLCELCDYDKLPIDNFFD